MNPHADIQFATPEPWSLLVGGIGRTAIVVAIVAYSVAVLASLLQARYPKLAPLAKFGLPIGCLAFVTAFGSILTLFVQDQFQYLYVFNHGAADHEFKYKVAGVWSGQEGSFLLWAVTSSLFVAIAARYTGEHRRWYTFASAVFLAGLGGILAYESPFFLLAPQFDGQLFVPPTGRGMAPSLLNYWITIHPPIIFLGFGSLTVLFAWAVSALITQRLDDWVRPMRPWAIVSLTFVGLGLCLGGFWAYETLGWGGFWMWDPVENVSFVPWVLTAALIHGVFVQIAKGKWRYGNALLAGLPFLSFVYGTFLTRSGFLGDTSVHSFAQMDRSAMQILVGLGAVLTFGFLGLYFFRMLPARKAEAAAKTEEVKPVLAKESFYASAIWLLCGFAVVTAFGMSVPLVMTLSGQQPRVVEEHLYHQVLAWLFPPLALGMAAGPFLGWRSLEPKVLLGRVHLSIAISVGIMGAILLWMRSSGMPIDPEGRVQMIFGDITGNVRVAWVLLLAWLCVFAVVANVWRMGELWRRAKPSMGGLLTHVGVMVAMFGLIFSRGLQMYEDIFIRDGAPATAFQRAVFFRGETSDITDRNNKVQFDVIGNEEEFVAQPGLYYTQGSDGELSAMMWPYIHRGLASDLYFAPGELVFDATNDTSFLVDDPLESSKTFENILLTLEDVETSGPLGQVGATFVATVRVTSPQGEQVVQPMIRIGEGMTMERNRIAVADDLILTMSSYRAETGEVLLKLDYATPLYPLRVFYKPMTGFVWLGVGIMTVGGFWAAWYRRTRRDPTSGGGSQRDVVEKLLKPKEETDSSHATATTSQS